MPYQLAELNIAHFKQPSTDPVNQSFFDNVAQVNKTAEQHNGFVWRLVDDTGAAEIFGDNMIVTLSKWQDIESLFDFVYRNSQHKMVMSRRHQWFEKMTVSVALWWVEEGVLPTLEQAHQRLLHLQKNGASDYVFNFAKRFAAPDA